MPGTNSSGNRPQFAGAGTSGAGTGANAEPARIAAALAAIHAKWADLKHALDALLESRLARAQDHLHQGREIAALPLLRALAAEYPADVNVLNLCGVAELRVGDAAAACTLIRRALALMPRHPGLLENLRPAERALAKSGSALRL